jgi:hypothetical protein
MCNLPIQIINMAKRFLTLFIAVLLVSSLGTACRRGSGCPANEQMQSANQDPAQLQAAMNKQKKKKSAPKSSVLPAEKKYVPRKKKH